MLPVDGEYRGAGGRVLPGVKRRPTPPPGPVDVLTRYGLPSDRVDCSLASTAPPWMWTWADPNVQFSDMPLYGVRRRE